MTNKEALLIWADALEFEDIPQVRSMLTRVRADGQRGFCGLGVACKKYADMHGLDIRKLIFGDLSYHLPQEVTEWLGITDETAVRVVRMNDDEDLTLPQIGAWVRDNLIKDE